MGPPSPRRAIAVLFTALSVMAMATTVRAQVITDTGDPPSTVPPAEPPPPTPEGGGSSRAAESMGAGMSDEALSKLEDYLFKRRSHFALIARTSYPLFLSGQMAGAPMAQVIRPGPSFELDAALTNGETFGTFFLGFEHTIYGLGSKSPYAQLAQVNSREERGWAGWRSIPNPFFIELAIGYSHLAIHGSDSAGNEASFGLDAFAARWGAGAAIHIGRRATLTFALEYALAIALGNASTSTRIGSQTVDAQGTPESAFRGGLAPSVDLMVAF